MIRGYEEQIERVVPMVAANHNFGMYLSTALTRMGKACWEFTDGTLPIYIGQWTMLSMSKEYSALLALQSHDLYFELRRTMDRFREEVDSMTGEQRLDAIEYASFIQEWLESVEVMAQEVIVFDG